MKPFAMANTQGLRKLTASSSGLELEFNLRWRIVPLLNLTAILLPLRLIATLVGYVSLLFALLAGHGQHRRAKCTRPGRVSSRARTPPRTGKNFRVTQHLSSRSPVVTQFQFGNLCLQQLFCPVIRIYDLAMPFARDAVAHQIEELALAEAHSRVCRMQSNV